MSITGLELSEIDKIQKELLAKCKLIQPSYTPIVDVAQYKEKIYQQYGALFMHDGFENEKLNKIKCSVGGIKKKI